MKKLSLLFFIILLSFSAACGNDEIEERTESSKTNSTANTDTTKDETSSIKVKEIESLIEKFLLAYNVENEEAFSQKLEDVFHPEFLPHYRVDYSYHQYSDVSNVKFDDSILQEKQPKFQTEVTFQFVDGEGSPREITQFVTANYLEESEGPRLTTIYFYENPEDVENRTYTAYNYMTKNVPVTHYGINFGLENIVNPVGREEEEDPIEFSIFRNLVVLYQAQYLEIDPIEYNRKAKFIYHPDVWDEFLIDDTTSPINGNLVALDVTTIEYESFERTSDTTYSYRAYYHFNFYDVEGNQSSQFGEVSAEFKQSKNGIKLVSLQFDFY